jgi:hypothetical protein
VARYQRLFREFITGWMADTAQPGAGGPAPLRAELMAAAVVAAHNHVLRRWLRGDAADPVREVDEAMQQVIALFATPGPPADISIAIFRTSQPADLLLPALQRLLADWPG